MVPGRPFCCGLWAVVCARRLARTVGSPWRNCCGGGRAPVAALRRRRHPRRDSPRGPTARTALRGTRTTAPPPAPKPVVAAKCASPLPLEPAAPPAPRGLFPSPIARVHLGHACAACADRLRLAHVHHVPPVARSARGRPAAASAWAPRSISSAPCPTARAASGEGVLPDAARACTPTQPASAPRTEPQKVRAVRLYAWHPTKCR